MTQQDQQQARIHTCEEEASSLALIRLHPNMSALLSSTRADLRTIEVQARALTSSDRSAVDRLSRALTSVERRLSLVRGSIRILRAAEAPAIRLQP
jgi:hypothetical protein